MLKIKSFFLGIIICCSVSSFAQTTDAGLTNNLNSYLKFTKMFAVDSILNMVYPRLFEVAPKAQVREAFIQAFNDEEIKITFDSVAITKTYPVEKFSKGMFSQFTFSNKMLMRFTEKQDSATLSFVKGMYEEKFGGDNVTVKGDDTFEIITTETALAIKDNYSKGKWTFLTLKAEQKKIVQKIVPLEIRQHYNIK
jgi:hypothetical protein